MKDKKSKARKIIGILCLTIGSIVVLLLPYIVEHFYYNIDPPNGFFAVKYDVKDLLTYYGSTLSFIGATILGVLTLHQNSIAQKKSDEVNRLQLELQKKSMAMAEAQYSKAQVDSRAIPKFEISLRGYNGNYAWLSLSIKNVTSSIVSCLTPISVIATDGTGCEIACAKTMAIDQRSLSSGQNTFVKTDFPELIKRIDGKVSYLNNISLTFSFSCEDEKGSTHYYRAVANIASTQHFHKELWDVKKVG